MSHLGKLIIGRAFLVAILVPWCGTAISAALWNLLDVVQPLPVVPWLEAIPMLLLLTVVSVAGYALGFWMAFRLGPIPLRVLALQGGATGGWYLALISPRLILLPFSTDPPGLDILQSPVDPLYTWPWLAAAAVLMVLIGWKTLQSRDEVP